MKRISSFNIIIYLVVITSYLSATVYKYSNLFDAILALSVIIVSFIFLSKKEKEIELKKLIIMIIISMIIIVTNKLNFISINLIILLDIIYKNNITKFNIKKYIKISIICFISVLIAYYIFNFNKQYDSYIWRVTTQNTQYRYCLGFNHANQAMIKWLGIALGLFTISNSNNIVKNSSIICFINIIIYKFTLSRTSFIIIFLVAITMIFFRKKINKNISHKFKFILAITPIIFSAISFLSIKLSEFTYINNLFSGRFMLYRKYIENYHLSFFGNTYIENNSMLDNSYLHMILSKGIIFFICYILLIYSLIKKSKNITINKFIIILAYFITGLIETILFKFDLLILIILIINENEDICLVKK